MPDSADRAGLTALQISAHRALQALGGTGTSWPLPRFIKTDDSLSHKQAKALDLGRMHLHDDNPQATVAVLRDLQHPAARNNLAVALFMIGDVAAARQVAEANWQSGLAGQGGPPNLAVADGDLKAVQAADEALAAVERQFSR